MAKSSHQRLIIELQANTFTKSLSLGFCEFQPTYVGPRVAITSSEQGLIGMNIEGRSEIRLKDHRRLGMLDN